MTVDLPEVVNALGGGPLAIGLVALGFLYWRALSRIDALTDRIISMSATQSEAMNQLARQIEKATDK